MSDASSMARRSSSLESLQSKSVVTRERCEGRHAGTFVSRALDLMLMPPPDAGIDLEGASAATYSVKAEFRLLNSRRPSARVQARQRIGTPSFSRFIDF